MFDIENKHLNFVVHVPFLLPPGCFTFGWLVPVFSVKACEFEGLLQDVLRSLPLHASISAT